MVNRCNDVLIDKTFGESYHVVRTVYDNLSTINAVSIKDIATLRTTIPTSDGQIITLLGHTTAGIGGGLFRYDASDTTTVDDNGLTIVTSGGKRWVRL